MAGMFSAPGEISATITSHLDSVLANGDRGVPPFPGWRRKAILRPSTDHTGCVSRDVEGAIKRIGWSGINRPMKLWSVRFETNASVLPSGDHVGDSILPRL